MSHNWVRAICEDQDGSLWIGTNGGLNRLKEGEIVRYTTKQGLSHERVTSIYEDGDGNLWIGTEGGGLNRFQGWKVYELHHERWLVSRHCEVNWVGTEGRLNRLKDGKLTSFTTKEGLSADWMTAICEDREGNLWIGGGGLSRFKDGRFTNYPLKGSLFRSGINSLSLDREGHLWIGTHAALIQGRQGKLTPYITQEQFPLVDVASVCKDREGTLWIATGRGLHRLKDGRFATFAAKDGLSHEVVTVVYEDRQGNLWLGTERGLDRFKEGRFSRCATREGLPATQVTSIYEDRDGMVWVATRGDGLFRWKDGQLTAYTTKEGLIDNVVTAVLEDGKGNLWMGSFKGIFCVSKKEFNDVAQGKISAVTPIVYGKADGMRSVECNSNHPPPGWKTKGGKLWFPTVTGVVMIEPDHMKLNTVPPPVVIEQVIADSKPIDLGQKTELPPGRA